MSDGNSQARQLVAIGAANMLLAVMLGAFGAHALKARITAEMLAVYQTGVQYHTIHALGMLMLGALTDRLGQPRSLLLVSRLFLLGILLFSGSLYALSLSGVRAFGAITPLGGISFMAGWALLALAAIRHTPDRPSGPAK